MKINTLTPYPSDQIRFAWSHYLAVPEKPGCYAITTFSGDVLYVGLATASIRSRMKIHLDTPEKRAGDIAGLPFWFHFLVRSSEEVASIERGWMNQSILEDGGMPSLNRIYSPL